MKRSRKKERRNTFW